MRTSLLLAFATVTLLFTSCSSEPEVITKTNSTIEVKSDGRYIVEDGESPIISTEYGLYNVHRFLERAEGAPGTKTYKSHPMSNSVSLYKYIPAKADHWPFAELTVDTMYNGDHTEIYYVQTSLYFTENDSTGTRKALTLIFRKEPIGGPCEIRNCYFSKKFEISGYERTYKQDTVLPDRIFSKEEALEFFHDKHAELKDFANAKK